MRIKRISIDSFGNIRNWTTPELTENLTVIYGPNEAGKSTITEFIRSTLFPGRNSKYPQPMKNDSGTVEVTMDDGDERILIREYKYVREGSGKRIVSEEYPNMDADAFRTLYCLDLEGLTDKKIITSDDFKSQFLTIPGGDKVSSISRSIENTLDSLMTKEKITDNRTIGRCLKEIKADDRRLAELRADIDRYDSLCNERSTLAAKVEDRRKSEQQRMDEAARLQIVRSQAMNLNRLKELNAERGDYESYRDIPLESKDEYDRLKSRLNELSASMEFSGPDSGNYPTLIAKKESIREMCDSRQSYVSDRDAVARLRTESEIVREELAELEREIGWSSEDIRNVRISDDLSSVALKEMRSPSRRSRIAAGASLVAAGIAGFVLIPFTDGLTVPLAVFGTAAAASGGYLLFRTLKRPSGSSKIWYQWAREHGLPENTSPQDAYLLAPKLAKVSELSERCTKIDSERAELESRMNAYVNSCFELFSSLGIIVTDLDTDISKLGDRLAEAESSLSRGEECTQELADASAALTEFLRPYGGEDGYLKALEGKRELNRLDSEIRMLTQSIESSAGMTVSELGEALTADAAEVKVEDIDVDAMNLRIGELNLKIDQLMDDDEVEAVSAHRSAVENELEDALREWAVNSVASNIINRVCDYYYTDLQPDLLWTANTYLGLMTEGRYQLDSDPRERDISIRDERSRKTSGQWSSGLGDQVYLSLKMAMAKEIGSESMPMILDDVVVRFDSDRKMGACKAIYELSRTNQVIVFTCESGLRNYFSLCGKFNEIKL